MVTLNSLQEQSCFDVSLAIARAWRVGYLGAPDDPRTNTGVLILIAPNERCVWIQLGYGSNKFISDEEATRIAGVMRTSFVEKQYGVGMLAGVSAIAEHFATRFSVVIETLDSPSRLQ